MKTIVKRPGRVITRRQGVEKNDAEQLYELLPVSKISFSPLNYRKFYDPVALDEFASQVAIRGVLSPVIVRRANRGGYELVAGERRLRAAQIAGLKTIPATVKELTDPEVIEIQLVENLQRENPHPLHEAQAVGLLQQTGKTLDEVARVLGKSKAFVYSRLRLSELIEPLQEVFFAGKLSMGEATDLGGLAKQSQEEFFAEHCTGWKEEKHFSIGNTRYYINRYKYDLRNAPFNPRDKKLVPEAGACSVCPFNSATLKTLFPDMAKEAVCSNKTCFKNKCLVSAELKLRAALAENSPAAVLVGYRVDEEYTVLLDSLPETVGLPRYDRSDVKVFKAPVEPSKDDYWYWNEEKQKNQFDKEGYQHCLQEYKEDSAQYSHQLEAETTLFGLSINDGEVELVYFNPTMRSTTGNSRGQQVTAKEVQQAIKEGVATPELLTAEIERLKTREERLKELDRQKVQDQLHEQFTEALGKGTLKPTLSSADVLAVRYILYAALSYQGRNAVDKILFPKGCKTDKAFFEKLASLTDEQFAFIARTVISMNSESKTATTRYAHCLYTMAAEDGLDVEAIETAQAAKVTERQTRLKDRIKGLQKQIAKLKLIEAA